MLCIVNNTYVRKLFHARGGQEVLVLKMQEDTEPLTYNMRDLCKSESRYMTLSVLEDASHYCAFIFALHCPFSHQETSMHSLRSQDYHCPEHFKPSFAWVQIMQTIRSRTSEVALLQYVTWHRLRHSVIITGLVLEAVGPCSVTQLSFSYLTCASYRTHRTHLHCQ